MKIIFLSIFTVTLLSLIISCATTKTSLEIETTEPVLFENEDISISIAHITENALIDLFGKSNNIFTQYPGLLFPKSTIVFQLSAKSKSGDISLNLRNILLNISDESGQSKYASQLLNDWSTYLKGSENKDYAEKLAKRNMLANKVTVNSENPATGLIVFLDKFPIKPEALISLGYTTENDEFKEIEIPMFIEEFVDNVDEQ